MAMIRFLLIIMAIAALVFIGFSSPVAAQSSLAPIEKLDKDPLIKPLTPDDLKKLREEDVLPPLSPEGETDNPDPTPERDDTVDVAPDIQGPDYSRMTSQEERNARLDILFERIKIEEKAEDANLIAEEIWAIWLDSDSDSVNFLLRRGTAAQKRGDIALARRLYDHVTTLSPDYAEGWSRSGRLALEEKDINRALVEITRALIIEPRHFYALWTLGNVFERLERRSEALEAYREANRLYPELKAVKDRLELMQGEVEGGLL